MNKVTRSLRFLLLILLYLLALVSQAQHLKSVMVNACAGGGSEGENEYLILQNDSLPLPINSQEIDIRYGNSYPASTTYSDSFYASGNASFVSALNTYLGGSCDFSFVNAGTSDTIPPDQYFMLLYGAPSDTIDYSAWCSNGIGDVYVLFSKDPSWSASGNFVNAPSNNRHFQTTIHGLVSNHTYTNGWSSNKDGNHVIWLDTGASSNYGNYSNCTPTNIYSLPVTYLSIQLKIVNNFHSIEWETASESNNYGFFIEQSTDAIHWNEIGFEPGNGSTFEQKSYAFPVHPQIGKTTFYRLKQQDYDGQTSLSKVVEFIGNSEKKVKVWWDDKTNLLKITNPDESELQIYVYNTFGNMIIDKYQDNSALQEIFLQLQNGVYHYLIEHDNKLERGTFIQLE